MIHLRPLLCLVLGGCLLAPALLGGCSASGAWTSTRETVDEYMDTQPTARPMYVEDESPMIELNYAAADAIAHDLSNDLNKDSSIFVERFVELTDPGNNAPFGAIVAEQVAARLSQLDWTVRDGDPVVTMGEQIGMDAGEDSVFLATNQRQTTPVVITGHYTIGDNMIFLSAKVVTLRDRQVLSGYQWTLPINQNTRQMLPQLRDAGASLTPSVETDF